MPLFTVFTPTYNRAQTIHRVYESLQNQTYRDFEWLIVDDGSTDNTKDLISEWKKIANFTIRYFYQPNGHKKTAFNYGVTLAAGELFLTADSDDALPPTALERFFHHWSSIPCDQKEKFVGVCGLVQNQLGHLVGDNFPGGWGIDSNSQEIRHKYGVQGEKSGFSLTKILRAHPFPENIPGHVPESVVWMEIASKYKTRFVNEVFRIYFQDSQDSLTNDINFDHFVNGALYWKGRVLTYEIRYFWCSPLKFLADAARWTRFRLHLGRKKEKGIHYWPKNKYGVFMIFIMAPIGAAWYLFDMKKIHA